MYEPKFTISAKILNFVARAEAARELIVNAALVPSYEVQFRKEALQRTVHFGTHLEGNNLSKEQAARIVSVEATQAEEVASQAGITATQRDVQEVINYRKLITWIDQLGTAGKQKVIISESLLKQIHALTMEKILADGERGEYRTSQVVVKCVQTGEISYRPPIAIEVPFQVDEFLEWLSAAFTKGVHPILLAGITHYELARIHPFVDGNGRTARALALLVLYLLDYDVKRFFSLEEYYDQDPASYYAALQSASNDELLDLTRWLEYFTEGIAIELDKIKQQVLKLSKDVGLKTKMGGHQVALSERQIAILEAIQKHQGRIVTGELESVLPLVSVDTILRDLKDLTYKGLIKKKGHTKGAFYTLVE